MRIFTSPGNSTGISILYIYYTNILSFIPITVNVVLLGIYWYVIMQFEVFKMYDKFGIANRIYIARKDNDLKQSDVCKILDINQSSYSALETGKRDATAREIFILADYLKVPAAWLLGVNSIPDLTDNERLDLENYIEFLLAKRK